MSAELSHFTSDALSLLATYVLHSTCLLVTIGLVLGCYRAASPAMRSGLWKLGAVAGFLTAPFVTFCAFPTPLADFPIAPRIANEQPPIAVEERVIPIPVPTRSTATSIDIADTNAPRSPLELSSSPDPEWISSERSVENEPQEFATHETTSPTFPSRPEQPDRYSNWALLIAGICLVLGVARLVSQSLLVQRRFGGCRPLGNGPAARELASLQQQQNVKQSVSLLSSPDYPVPVAFGLFRWHIVLPDRAEAELSRNELRALLAHELAHLVRRDSWWLYFGQLLCTAFAYQPLNFWARRQWQQSAEFLCDQWAVERTGDRMALANCLTTVAGWRLGTPVCGGSLAATGNRSTLTRRVERLINGRLDKVRWSRSRAFLVAMTAVAAITLLISFGPKATFALPATNPPEPILARDAAIESLPHLQEDELTLLRQELSQLADELQSLEALIARAGMTPRMRSLADKLRRQMQHIEQQARALETSWRESEANRTDLEKPHITKSHNSRPNVKESTP